MFSHLVNRASHFAMEGVKQLIVKQHVNNYLIYSWFYLLFKKLPVTKIVDNLMECRSSPETDDYRYFDPKLRSSDR